MTITLTLEQYESLLAFAQAGVRRHEGQLDQQQALVLDAALQDIEKSNNIVRYQLWIRWQDPTAPLPPGSTNFPKSWPPNLEYFLQFISRPIAKTDVLGVVFQKTPNAQNIMVTPDPAALLGWTKVDDFFTMP
jgi:hypothetical protein